MPAVSDTAKSILTILNNVNELIVVSNDRSNARDVMKALKIYANGKSFPIPEDRIQNFQNVLIDSRPYTLSYLIRCIAQDVMMADKILSKAKAKIPAKKK